MRDDRSSRYEPFSVTVVDVRDDGVMIIPVGELDLACTDELAREVRRARASGSVRVVLDLRGIQFIDSAGLRLLLSLRNDAKRNGHRLILVPPGRAVGRIFEITATRGLFDCEDGGRTGTLP